MRRFQFVETTLLAAVLVASSCAQKTTPAIGKFTYRIQAAPVAPHNITVFPERDFVVVDGFPANTEVTISVRRRTLSGDLLVIGTASGVTDAAGFTEVNHPGGLCWSGVYNASLPTDPNFRGTPDILPGDEVQVTYAGQPAPEETVTADIRCGRPFTRVVNGQTEVVITGTALTALGDQIPIEQLEERLVNPDPGFLVTGRFRRQISALSVGGEGLLTYDAANNRTSPTNGRWTAVYRGLSPDDVQSALAAESRVLWLGPNVDDTQLTIFEDPGAPGPFQFDCSVFAYNAITAGPSTINASNAATVVTLSGVAQANATLVTVRTGPNQVRTATPAGCNAQRVWSISVPASEFASGTSTLVPEFTLQTVTGTPTIKGAPFRMYKDTANPVVTLSSTTGAVPLNVTLSGDTPDVRIFFTLDGPAPTENSAQVTGPVAVNTAATLRFLAIDQAGNQTTGQATYGAAVNDTLAPTVTANPASGTPLNAASRVTLTMSEPGSTFYATSAGNALAVNPTTPYTGPVAMTEAAPKIWFRAVDSANNQSTINSATYPVDTTPSTLTMPGRVAPPTVTRLRTSPTQIPVTSSEPSTDIVYFTVDGTDPRVSATRQRVLSLPGSITLTKPRSGSGDVTLNVIVEDRAGNPSPVMTTLFKF